MKCGGGTCAERARPDRTRPARSSRPGPAGQVQPARSSRPDLTVTARCDDGCVPRPPPFAPGLCPGPAAGLPGVDPAGRPVRRSTRVAGGRGEGGGAGAHSAAGARRAAGVAGAPGAAGAAGDARATQAAGRSALAAWKRERRARQRRLVLVVLLAIVSAAAVCGWAAQAVGVITLSSPPWPLLALGVGAGSTVAAVWPRFDPARWARGAAGELATAVLLERLPRSRWVVLHDLAVPGSRANVDHLVIGPTGVWVVDTKAYRARVVARWGRVTVGGVPLSMATVRWEASVVSDVLGIEARAIIAVHARGLRRRGQCSSGVRVVPADRLVRRLRRGRYFWPSLRARQVRELGELAERRLART